MEEESLIEQAALDGDSIAMPARTSLADQALDVKPGGYG